jgi:hypothetical protein
MAKPRQSEFDASFGLANHALRVQELGKALLRQAATALGATDPDDISTINRGLLDPDTLNTATKIFSSVSAQLSSVAKLYEQISGQNRDAVRERVLVDCLKSADPALAERFLALYGEEIAKSGLGDG